MKKRSYFSFFLVIVFLLNTNSLDAQTVDLGCQDDTDAFVGLDRKDWNNGSTDFHSEGMFLNFEFPNQSSWPCKKIQNVEISLTVFLVDDSGLDASCGVPNYYVNIYSGCGDFSPASCDVANLVAEPNSFNLNSQTLNYDCDDFDFQFGDILGVDIVPAIGNVGCPNGQSAISSGDIVIEYEMCIEITLEDLPISLPLDLGMDLTVCEGETVNIDAGSAYDEYDWDPNGENTQDIDAGVGVYELTVTDNAGCTDTDIIEVFESIPIVGIDSDDPDNIICGTGTVELTANTTESDILWSTGEDTEMITVGPGNYQVVVTDDNNCTAEATVDIIGAPEPTVVIDSNDPDNTLCGNEMLELTANTTASDILWSTGEDTEMITVGPGNYQVVVTDDNNCTAEAMIDIVGFPEPSVDIDPDALEVCGDEETSLTATSGFESYLWNSGEMDQIVDISAGIHEVTVTDINGCTASSAVEVVSIEPPNAGDGGALTVCNDDQTYDVEALLGDADDDGDWEDLDNSGVNVNIDPDDTSFEFVTPGVYQFEYTVSGINPCPDDSEIVTITVIGQPDAGESTAVSLCSNAGEQDFYDIIDANDFDGDWSDSDMSGLDLSDPFNVDISSLLPGTYEFEYSIEADSPCSDAVSILELNIDNSPNAGMDNSVSVCEGAIIDLNTALSDTATPNGTFEDTDGSGALSGSLFDTEGFAGQSFSFNYMVGDAGLCGMDEATIEVEISTAFSAGNDSTALSICIGDTLDLYDYIPDADLGGIFEDLSMSGALLNNLFVSTNAGPGIFEFNYIIGDNIDCPADTALISLPLVPEAGIDILGGASLCSDQCSELSISFSGTPAFNLGLDFYNDQNVIIAGLDSTTMMNSISLWVCHSDNGGFFLNDTLFIDSNSSQWYLLYNSMSDSNCILDPMEQDTIFYYPVESIQTNIDSTVCTGDEIMIEGEVFNAANPTGMITIPSMQSCDSIINVTLSFFEPADSLLMLTLCPDESIIVNGTVYDINNPNGSETIVDGSINNCDSLVVIDLDFDNEYFENLSETICEGDSIFLAGDWQMMSGFYLDSLLSVEGCDSILQTELIVEICELQYNISTSNNLCANGEEGSFCVSIQDSDLPVNVSWMNLSSGIMGSFSIDVLDAGFCEIYLSSGDYSIVIEDSSGAELASEIISIVDENEELIANITQVQQISCFNAADGEILANISGGATPYTLSWNPDIGNNPQIAGLGAGTYSLVVIDDESCSTTSEITIVEPDQIEFDITVFDATCDLATDGEIIVTNITGGTGPYSICLDGNEVDDGGMITGLDANQYNIEIKDSNNCTASELINVTAQSNPTLIDITENYEITSGESIQLSGSIAPSVVNITWSPDLDISCTDCDTPIFSPSANQTYDLIVTDASGCVDMAQVNIVVSEPEVEFLLPNIFTPNNDGVNDTFDIILSDLAQEYTMRIFDRWGNVVFEGEMLSGSDNGWDGKMDGSFVSTGVYSYLINFERADSSIEYRAGSITVIR